MAVDAALPPPDAGEPPPEFWRREQTYGEHLSRIAEALPPGETPDDVAAQLPWLRHLHWYFTVDARERAPTVACTESMAPAFHDAFERLMPRAAPAALQHLHAEGVDAEICHALWSYQRPEQAGTVTLDALDHELSLVRLRYYIHGRKPSERFLVDGQPVEPRFAKYRGCKYFHRVLMRQRIAWLPVPDGARAVTLELDGRPVPVMLGPRPFTAGPDDEAWRVGLQGVRLDDARRRYAPGRGGQEPLPPGWPGLKVRLMRWLAALPTLRRRFDRAWVFIDREQDADDNAEHLYRWVKQHQPQINAWFLLTRDSRDWDRLAAEGFRLMPPGLMRKLLILNCEQLISSHTDYAFAGMDRRRYGDAMRWRCTFLQHGVIKDDISHWLAPCEFDRFITSSPAEHASVVGDDTAYPYTERETVRTGMPRHDRLLRWRRQVPPAERNLLLVMPTWRAGLVDGRAGRQSAQERKAQFAQSDYARHWRRVLRHVELHEQLERHGMRLAFMPHYNAEPFLDVFDPAPGVEIVRAVDGMVQKVFARTRGFVTDYTSVAFTMALLRCQVFYYQFDQASFYSGGHNWRPGYFDYERDGFGPVVTGEADLVSALRAFIQRGGEPEPMYLQRMQAAMPEEDELSCQRVYDSILATGRPSRT